MSYQYSWGWETPMADSERFAQWSRDVITLLTIVPYYAHWSVEPHTHTHPPSGPRPPFKICGPDGIGEPVITASEVMFNGDATTGNSYETFSISLQELQHALSGGRCKTNQKPYTLLVTAALVRLTSYFPQIQVWSDMGIGGLRAGTQLCCEVFGHARNPAREFPLGPGAISDYPNLAYFKYLLAWYEHRHPHQAIRSATLEGKVRLAPSLPHDPAHPLSFDIVNDSATCVWNVQTGWPFTVLFPNVGVVPYGSDFPLADDVADEAVRLARQFGLTHYHLGTLEYDPFLQPEETIYFRDGSIMRVRIPEQVSRSDGQVVAKGIIIYSIIDGRQTLEPICQVIEPEAYQALYHTTESILSRMKLLGKDAE